MTDIIITDIAEIYKIRRGHWDGHFVYRGEGSTSYELRPKLGRGLVKPYVAKGGNTFPVPAHELVMLNKFKRFAAPYLDRQPIDDWDWLAIAQHHGLATRLLDWTTNILVAAYFACCDPGKKRDSVIYALNTDEVPDAPMDESPFSLKENVVLHPRHSTARIVAQSGLFTSHADPAQLFVGGMLHRIVLPASLLIELGVTLSTYDVSKSKLFPGLDSIAEHVNERHGCR